MDLNQITIDDNKNIISVNFIDSMLDKTCIKNMGKWDNIPKFSLITGRNGTGKTQLLSYIKKYIVDNKLKTKLILQNDTQILNDFEFSNLYSSNPSNSFYYSDQTIISLRDKSLDYIYQKNNEIKDCNHNDKYFGEYLGKLDQLKLELDTNNNNLMRTKVDEALKKLMISENKENKLLNILTLMKKRNAQIENMKLTFCTTNFVEDIKYLRQYYDQNYENVNSEDFFTRLTDPTRELIENYANSKIYSFSDALNSDLEKHGFQIQKEEGSNNFFIAKKINNSYTKIEKLSTGEMFMLNLLAFKYECNDLTLEMPNVILFDEPDRSFDPDFIRIFLDTIYKNFCLENNIQIIMTTHRADTVKLASTYSPVNIGVFSVKKDEITSSSQIKRCDPLLATFRLTFDREIYSLKIKVYVESLDDFEFYNIYYSYLNKICQELREKNKKNIFLLLSRRYQLQFFPTAKDKAGGGGCKEVIASVKRDCNSIDYKKSLKNQLIKPCLEKPFGIIDLDYYCSNTYDRVLVLKRYSIENYMIDPILLFHNHTERKNLINSFSDSTFKEICLNCFNNSIVMDYENENSIFTAYSEYFKEIIKCLLKYKGNDLDDYLKHLRKKTGQEDIMRELSSLDESEKVKYLLKYEKISYFYVHNDNYDTMIFETKIFNYPAIFLYFRGKTIFKNIFSILLKKDEQIKLNESILYDVKNTGYYFMPQDLVAVLLDLNNLVRNQANSELKKSDEENRTSI